MKNNISKVNTVKTPLHLKVTRQINHHITQPMDSLIQYPCFVGPSKIKTLIVPVGKWTVGGFNETVNNLKQFNEIRLLDITPIDSTLFNPQGFPNGRLFFNFTTLDHNDELDLFLYDFEPFRKTFVLIGLVNDNSDPAENLSILQEKYSTVISHNLIYIKQDVTLPENKKNNVFFYNNNLETIVCDIGRNFLTVLNHYYSSYKHVTLRSPGTIGGNAIAKTVINRYSDMGTVLSNTISASSKTHSNKTTTSTPSTEQSTQSKRLSTFEITTNNLKRSASIKLATTLTSSESKAQQRSRGRQLKILGNFQLLAGRYSDALASFTESISLLYKVRDLLWLASALDGIAMSFILLSYLNITFAIPEIIDHVCPLNIHTTTANNPSTNDDPTKKTASTTPRNSVSITPLQMQASVSSPRSSLVGSGVDSYSNNNSASNLALGHISIEDISLPRLIRLIGDKILYYYELSLSHNTEYVPQIVYCNTLLKLLMFIVKCQKCTDQFSPNVLNDIINQSFNPENIKHNLLTNEPIQFTQGDVIYYMDRTFELQIKDMSIELQCKVYSTMAKIYNVFDLSRKEAFNMNLLAKSLMQCSSSIMWHSDYQNVLDQLAHSYSCYTLENAEDCNEDRHWLSLQKIILQLIIQVSERLNDLNYMTKYSLILLTKYSNMLTPVEQDQLIKTIKLGIKNDIVTEYWNDNIIKNVTIKRQTFNNSQASMLPLTVPNHKSNERKSISPETDDKSVVQNEEVFNPFKQVKNISDKDHAITSQVYLVYDEADFSCVLQNPYKVPLLITKVNLTDEVQEFCEIKDNYITMKSPCIISPQSIATINLPILFKRETDGKFQSIKSILLSVFGMPMQEFKINKSTTTKDNVASDFNFKILPEQPHLQVLNTSKMTGNSIMMLDGTQMKIPLKMINKSLSCNISYLKLATISNVEKDLKPDYWQKLQPDKLHCFDSQLQKLKTECIKITNAPNSLNPNEIHDFELDVNLSGAPSDFKGFELIIEYGMESKDGSYLFIKELRTQYDITIRKSLEVSNIDIIPLNENITECQTDIDWIQYVQKELENNTSLNISDFALFLVDFRNSWIDGIALQTSFANFTSKEYLVEAQHTMRIIIPIRKFKTADTSLSNKPIPTLFKGRQFIQCGMSKAQEGAMREKFWCHDYILHNLQCQWKFSHDDTTVGTMDFRKPITESDCDIVPILYANSDPFVIKLRTESISVLKGHPFSVEVSLSPSHSRDFDDIPTVVSVNLLVFDNKTSKLLLSSNRRVICNGSLSRLVSSNEQTTSFFELFPIEKGEYRISACIASGLDRNNVIQVDTSIISVEVN